MTEATIRFAKETDLAEIVELCHQHALYEKSEYDKTGKQEKLKTHLFCDQPHFNCLVAEVHNEVVGYATYIKQFATWDADFYIYMDCLFLNEKSRGYGIGEQIMNRIKEESQKMGCNLIQWQTPDFNTGAIRFYKRIGATSKSKERFFLEF
ncbi:GNAT family N-acetyltransferase [Rhodohalobacter sp. SW132]|uniref:GNAT family N-acetyltransferase n=1 Tax=Rhodohalobacter sp. SW132 TaxID=2293433 RepID=UPI000E232FAF|nr:GNAT family N-acetyltransferase [Rhodohalobacter sp. SW132]REL24017.1 GNAT family N-acetyltransferase [Rhodohalobacter sp. SW132]